MYLSKRKCSLNGQNLNSTKYNHLPTNVVRATKRSVKQGGKFNFFTKKVSSISKTGIENTCYFQNITR